MTNIASTFILWEDDEFIYSQVTTNASWLRLFGRLEAVGLATHVQQVSYYRKERAAGGSGYVILWNRISLEDLKTRLVSL